MRTESTPLGKFDEEFNALFWEASPYKWPVVGWPSDIPMYTLQQAKDYFATYYAPNNITGVLVGDFKTAEVKPLLERYFGRIPRGTVDPPPVVTLEPKQLGEKRFDAEAETSPTVRCGGRAVPFVHKDLRRSTCCPTCSPAAPGGSTRGSCCGRKIANEASASIDQQQVRRASSWSRCTVKDGKEPAAVEAAVYDELDKLKTEPVPAEELQKVKNQDKANAYRRLSSTPTFIMFQLAELRRARRLAADQHLRRAVDAVTAADVQRVAKQYLTKENRTVGIFLRKEGAAPEDPEIATLPAAGAGHGPAGLAADRGARRTRRSSSEMVGADAADGRTGAAGDEAGARPDPEEGQERLAALSGGKK